MGFSVKQRIVDTEMVIICKCRKNKIPVYAGGIVQGMSGSPIIQNNRLVGAVTHVFVNDPSRGYGIFVEWMIQESGMLDKLRDLGALDSVLEEAS